MSYTQITYCQWCDRRDSSEYDTIAVAVEAVPSGWLRLQGSGAAADFCRAGCLLAYLLRKTMA